MSMEGPHSEIQLARRRSDEFAVGRQARVDLNLLQGNFLCLNDFHVEKREHEPHIEEKLRQREA